MKAEMLSHGYFSYDLYLMYIKTPHGNQGQTKSSLWAFCNTSKIDIFKNYLNDGNGGN